MISDITAELGRGCGSASWCYGVWADHNWLIAMCAERAQEEVWAESHDVLCSTGFTPVWAEASLVEAGFRISGRWQFASGCDSATWMMVAATVPAGPTLFLVPSSDYTIDDTWFVSGLRGTGSKDILMEDVFVPQHRALLWVEMEEAPPPAG